VDFLLSQELLAPNIITNPPYIFASEFLTHAFDLKATKVAMFLKLTFLEGKARHFLFKKYPPKKIWAFSSRRMVARNGDPNMFLGSSAVAFSWFVWEKDFKGEPTIGWIL